MAEPMNSPEETALWQRWRLLARAPAGEPPDALMLAAYAEGRLGPTEMEAVEEWLCADADLAADIAIARSAGDRPPPGSLRMHLPPNVDQPRELVPSPSADGEGQGEAAPPGPFPLFASLSPSHHRPCGNPCRYV